MKRLGHVNHNSDPMVKHGAAVPDVDNLRYSPAFVFDSPGAINEDGFAPGDSLNKELVFVGDHVGGLCIRSRCGNFRIGNGFLFTNQKSAK